MQRYATGKQLRSQNIRTFTGPYVILLALLFLTALNIINRFYYMAFCAVIFLFLVQYDAIKLPRAIMPALLLSVSMCIFSPSVSYTLLGLLKQFTYPLCVLIGYNLIYSNDARIAEKQSIILTIVLALGAYGHYLLNQFMNRGVILERNMLDFMTKSVLSATGQAALAFMIVAVATALLFMPIRKLVKIPMVAILGSVLYYNLMLAGRTLFVLSGVAMAVAFVAKFIVAPNPAVRIKLLVGMGIIGTMLIVLFSSNAFGIQDIIAKSNFYDRFFGDSAMGVDEDGRLENKLKYLSLMWEYPFGGGEIHRVVGGYAHDIIFDTYDEGGFFALLAIMLLLIDMVVKCLKIFRNPRVSENFTILVVTFLVVVMLEFMVEPILVGMPWLLASYCVLYGAYGRLAEMS